MKEDLHRIARKITAVLFLAQSLSSAAFIAATTVNAIVGADLSGNLALAGVPLALYVLGQAVAAVAWGYTMDRIGRRGGLVLGQMVGMAGAIVAAAAVVGRSFPLFLLGMALMGASRAAVDLGRFAAAEVHLPSERGRAISRVVMGGTVGAIVGPLAVGPAGSLAASLGVDELAGTYGFGLATFAAAAVLVFVGLRPDPRDVGRKLAALHPTGLARTGETRALAAILRDPGVVVAIGSVVFSQMAMVMLMVITSVHMKGHQHGLTAISLVITSHTLGMFAFSILSGRLTDRWGRAPVIATGGATMALSCAVAPWSSDLVPLALALFLLGLGWNLAYVAGSTLLSDRLSPLERAKTQGFNDLMLGLASATGSFGSGLVFAAAGYGAMALAGGIASLVPLALALWWQRW